ncbi:MAG: hypothetical protein NT169_01725 [Chloroflexi bacterium]|nr:hypothetical protein [Chloroflexota bacterium]
MSMVIDYRQRLLEETSDLSPLEMEKIYQAVVFIKEKFLSADETRYYTPSWIEAEREATAAHARGGLPRFHSVREMAEYIEAGVDEAAG